VSLLARVDGAWTGCDKVSRAYVLLDMSGHCSVGFLATPRSSWPGLVEGSICLVVVHVSVLVALLTASISRRLSTAALHKRHDDTFACASPGSGRGQDSVSKATIPACMTLGDMHAVGLYSDSREC